MTLLYSASNNRTVVNKCPLRFIMRDGEKILQSPYQDLGDGSVEWADVPVEKPSAICTEKGQNIHTSLERGHKTEENAHDAMKLLVLTSAIHALIGYASLRAGDVITEGYVKRMNDYYVPQIEKALAAMRSK